MTSRSLDMAADLQVRRGSVPASIQLAAALQAAIVKQRLPRGRTLGGSANRDPDAFTNADKFDTDRDRTEAQNLGFGYGVHGCLGAAPARMESAIALEKLLDLMPRYQVIREGCKRVSMTSVAGWSHVPVRGLP